MNKKDSIIPISPSLAPIPNGCSTRLIDNGMLHYEASMAGFNERYRRGETSHTIHVWWARRPHSAMRALLFASICKSDRPEAVEIMQLISDNFVEQGILEKARQMLVEGYSSIPKVLDMFGGGGTIPFEAKNLGFDTYSIDANELSVFIQKCNLIYKNGIDTTIADNILQESGNKVLSRLKADTDWLFPMRVKSNELLFGYMWTYSMKCVECGYKFYLTKRPWLTKKNEKSIAFVLTNDEDEQNIAFKRVAKDYSLNYNWDGKSSTICPKCGKTHSNISIKKCKDELVAMIQVNPEGGKLFLEVEDNVIPSNESMAIEEQKLLNELNIYLPNTVLPRWSGIVNPALYGVETHSDFINQRQRLLLLYLIRLLINEYQYLFIEKGENIAKYVIGSLSGLIDQLVDWNCRLSMWIPQNEQVGRAFCGPGISMLWDYAETDPVLHGPANLWDKLERIIKGTKSFDTKNNNVHIVHAYAQELPFEDDFFDAIVTDPPYYDNIYYSILADFFYAWKKPLLQKIEDGLFNSLQTDCSRELVASSIRNESAERAHKQYCEQLNQAIVEAARVLKKDGVFSFVYSHSSINGWDAIIQAFRNSPFIITSVQPLSIERKSRPRAFTSEAVNTCITLVARKSFEQKDTIHINTLMESISTYVDDFGRPLEEISGWKDMDAGLAVFACMVSKLANIRKVIGIENDVEALKLIANRLRTLIPEFKIQIRSSL